MQNKGFVKVIAVALTLVCLFYLSFSAVTHHYEKKAAEMGPAGQAYLDSMKNERVWLGVYTLKRCQELQISLGLDLQGGMNVILEVSVPDVIKSLAGENAADPTFQKALAQAQKQANESTGDVIELFVKNYQQLSGMNHLGGVFTARLRSEGITPNSTDADVQRVLTDEVKAAVGNSYEVLRTRIDRFGVAQPNIQTLEGKGQLGQIMVEMPGIKEPERVRKLLQGSANLEFWETYNAGEISAALATLDNRLAQTDKAASDTTATAVAATDTVKAAADTAKTSAEPSLAAFKKDADKKADAAANKELEAFKAQHPLFGVLLQDVVSPQNCVIGIAQARDTAAVNRMLQSELARDILPADLRTYWGVKASDMIKGDYYELYALKATDGKAAMAGDMVEGARDDYDEFHRPCVSMTMNTEGAREWAVLTRNNIKRCVAIVLDGYVYSAPTVQNETSGGVSSITGNFTTEDTKDLANVLRSGKMPAPAKIVQEEMVGPSLGAASIQAGFTACVVAFVALMVFMCVYYGFIPGMVANGALILNFFFTFGVLTSFQAALTMSGIAGMVLSLGMAVDANVLIYERTKEELRAGKNIKQALADGYGNAFSAIFDSNLTSIITAVILFYFGTGPIRGFATTLIIGICASFFTAVWMTRIVYEHFMNKDKWLNLKFNTKLSRGFLENTNVQFMTFYRRSFTIFAVFLAVCLVSLGVRGLSKGIDFTGGRNFVVQFEQQVTPEEVSSAIADKVHAVDPEANVSALALGTDGRTVRLTTNYRIEDNADGIDEQVEHFIYEGLKERNLIKADYATFIDRDNHKGGSIISSQKVGPSVAEDMTRGAIVSVILSLVAIFLYILIRFRNVAFSVGCVISLTVDTLIIIGIYSLCWGWMPFSLEVDQTFIGAVLTAIGYSINDKVVVFDRIREYLGLYPNRERRRLFNDSLNHTLSRTIMTSGTTLLVLLCILFLGGDSVRSFSFAMILGVIFGTLSSIFLAAPIAYLTLSKRERKEGKAVATA